MAIFDESDAVFTLRTWLPTNIPNCVGDWFSDYGITKDGADRISNVLDRSDNLHPAYQATDAKKPVHTLVDGIYTFYVDGADDFLKVDNHADFNCQSGYSIIVWVKLTREAAAYDCMVTKVSSYGIYSTSNLRVSGLHYQATVDKNLYTAINVVDKNLWRMYAAVWAGTTNYKFYEFANEVALASGSTTGPPDITANPIQLFSYGGTLYFTKGYCGGITIYNRGIIPTEITEYYTNTKARYGL